MNRDEKVFELKRVLPAGMTFRTISGFVPQRRPTTATPFDVLVLLNEPAFTASVLRARMGGIIEGEQSGNMGKSETTAWLQRSRTSTVVPTSKRFMNLGRQFVREPENSS